MFQLKSWVHYMYFYITCIIVVHHITIILNQIKPCTITTNPKFYIVIQIITLTYDYFSNVREKLTKFNKTKIGLLIIMIINHFFMFKTSFKFFFQFFYQLHSKLKHIHHFFGQGWKHIKPPKICNHKYNLSIIIIVGNVWTSHLGLFLFVLSIFG